MKPKRYAYIRSIALACALFLCIGVPVFLIADIHAVYYVAGAMIGAAAMYAAVTVEDSHRSRGTLPPLPMIEDEEA